jgi:hypothetical protein
MKVAQREGSGRILQETQVTPRGGMGYRRDGPRGFGASRQKIEMAERKE